MKRILVPRAGRVGSNQVRPDHRKKEGQIQNSSCVIWLRVGLVVGAS